MWRYYPFIRFGKDVKKDKTYQHIPLKSLAKTFALSDLSMAINNTKMF